MHFMCNSVRYLLSLMRSSLIVFPDNNYCGLNNFANANDWNFATWFVGNALPPFISTNCDQGQLGKDYITEQGDQNLYWRSGLV